MEHTHNYQIQKINIHIADSNARKMNEDCKGMELVVVDIFGKGNSERYGD